MSNNENFQGYMNRVFNVLNAIRSLGEDLLEIVVVKKILRSLLPIYNPKVSVLEDKDLTTVSLDELQRTMVAYEMRMEMPGSVKVNKEVSFQTMKKLKLTDEDDGDSDDDVSGSAGEEDLPGAVFPSDD